MPSTASIRFPALIAPASLKLRRLLAQRHPETTVFRR